MKNGAEGSPPALCLERNQCRSRMIRPRPDHQPKKLDKKPKRMNQNERLEGGELESLENGK